MGSVRSVSVRISLKDMFTKALIGYDNGVRAYAARLKGFDTYVSLDGKVRMARTVKRDGVVNIPIEHYELMKLQSKNLSDRGEEL